MYKERKGSKIMQNMQLIIVKIFAARMCVVCMKRMLYCMNYNAKQIYGDDAP